jgi:hypothetical protein
MERKYEYRRHLPHFQGDCTAIFATFSTHHRWILPAALEALPWKPASGETANVSACTEQ